jgi:hypothetical protein
MEKRISMNTKSLQKEFKSEYEGFFAKHDLVLSACNSFPWNLWFWYNKNKIHIKQKIPTKTYIWINIASENKIMINSVHSFDVLQQSFNIVEFKNINKKNNELMVFIQNYLEDQGYTKWLEIDFLSENPRGHGLAFSWTAGVLLATAIFLLLKKITLSDIKDYDTFTKSPIFEEIFQLWRKIDDISKYGNSIGNNCYVAMMNGGLPVVIFSEEYDTNAKKTEIKTYKKPIKDFLKIKNDISELHLDYGIIYSGIENKIEHIHQLFSNTEEELLEIEKASLEILKDNGINKTKWFPFERIFEKHFLQSLEDGFFVLNFKLLYMFKLLLQKGFDEQILIEFIQTINENNDLGMFFEKHNKIFPLYKFWFDHYKKNDDEIIWLFPINTSKTWWSFVFVAKHNKSRDTILNTIKKLQEIWHKNLNLEYASWLDGTGEDGIQIEQWINSEIFSAYIQKDQVYYKDNQWESYIGNYNEILAKNKTGLLLDMMHNKMYLNGKKLTSNDLCSQTTTINVLYQLMENIWADIANKEFEISSYSKNKNEMLGKIVLPLISLIEKETGEMFPLICKGSIYDFYMKLNPSIIKVAFVKKI